MTCERIEDLLSGLIDHELDPPTTEAVNEHLRSCPACRQEFEELQLIVQQSAALEPLEPPDRLYWTIRNKARSAPPRPWFAPQKIGWVLVPALATAALMLVLFPRNRAAQTLRPESYASAPEQPGVRVDTGQPAPVAAEPVPSVRAEFPAVRRPERSAAYSTAGRSEPVAMPVAASPLKTAAIVQPASVAMPSGAGRGSPDEVIASLHSIQQALEEVEAALQENPGNVQVQVAYRATYQKGMELKQRYALGAR
jgi:anti-sigma factor RsiW